MQEVRDKIRNFAILAHIDHGKSTLADRFLELTGTVEKRKMREQMLDQMDLERERGITIKLQPVRMEYELKNPKSKIPNSKQIQNPNDQNSKQCFEHLNFEFRNSLGFSASNLGFANSRFILNLIDTPGHVDFTYEVSRSLACVEGAILLVDATQGIQAQTLANLYLALEQNLTIIPVVNKIDLVGAQIEKTKKELINLLGCPESDIILASGKTGQGTQEILEAIIKKVPPPKILSTSPLRALIFDSIYDDYKGVIAYVRLFDGQIKPGQKIKMLATATESEVLEVGFFKPELVKSEGLSAGEIGYIVTGFKDVNFCRVGDTITLSEVAEEITPLPGYKEVKPMVFAGIFCREGADYNRLREAVEKLKLSDAALTFTPEHSPVLGFGLRCGFLGLLHLDIVQERLKREYGLELVITVPSVAYQVKKKSGQILEIKSPLELPDPSQIEYVEEPIMNLDIFTPKEYLGEIMKLTQEKRGYYLNTEYLSEDRVILHYKIPLASLIVDFYDKLKSASSGYASLNYELVGFKKAEIIRIDILVAEEPVEALATIVYKDEAYKVGRQIVEKLKKTLPRQQFVLKIQVASGGKIIAAEKLSALRKDVTANLYGGDVTRKKKLLEKQKKGKKKMMERGRGKVDIPTQVFLEILKR